MRIEGAASPEVLGENGHLIKCMSYLLCLVHSRKFANDVFVFRAHVSYRYGALTSKPSYERTQQRLVSTRGAVSQKPSNSILDRFI
jgi:hypothetical protein